jgi:hypothetical protein
VLDIPGQVAGAVLDVPGQVIGGVLGGTANGGDVLGFGRGNGRFAYRTVIERMDIQTGKVMRMSVHSGQPFMMNKDVSIMKTTLKKISNVNKRVPRKTRAESRTKQLTEAAIDRTMRDLNSDGSCK